MSDRRRRPARRYAQLSKPAARGIPFLNESGETVPPFGVMRVKRWHGHHYTINQFAPGNPANRAFWESIPRPPLFLFNGPTEIEAGAFGYAQDELPYICEYDDSDTTTVGQQDSWGPRPGEWKLFFGHFWFRGESVISRKSEGDTDNLAYFTPELRPDVIPIHNNNFEAATITRYTPLPLFQWSTQVNGFLGDLPIQTQPVGTSDFIAHGPRMIVPSPPWDFEDNATGFTTIGEIALYAFDTTDPTAPVSREEWGLKHDERKLFKGYPGMQAVGRDQGATGFALFRRRPYQVLHVEAPAITSGNQQFCDMFDRTINLRDGVGQQIPAFNRLVHPTVINEKGWIASVCGEWQMINADKWSEPDT